VWVLAKLSGQIVIGPDDAIDKFLLLSNTHDGSGAVSIRFTPIRVVCQNTLNWAEEGGSSVIAVRHSKNIAERLKDAQDKELKQIIDKIFAEAETLFGAMAVRSLQADETDRFLELLFPRTDKQRRRIKSPSDGLASGRCSMTRGSRRHQPEIRYGASTTRSSEPKTTGTAGKARRRVSNDAGHPPNAAPAKRSPVAYGFAGVVR